MGFFFVKNDLWMWFCEISCFTKEVYPFNLLILLWYCYWIFGLLDGWLVQTEWTLTYRKICSWATEHEMNTKILLCEQCLLYNKICHSDEFSSVVCVKSTITTVFVSLLFLETIQHTYSVMLILCFSMNKANYDSEITLVTGFSTLFYFFLYG